ncbi:hypothetical protein HYDPIDRAFT_24420 [Hydnomerulius pinastri MD-312]|nr:hypothetical protein HYDPIDRAFT_24420 [Hydnomerulius pinastri MD-312]
MFKDEFVSIRKRKRCPKPTISTVIPVSFYPKSRSSDSFTPSLHVASSSTSLTPECSEAHSADERVSGSPRALDASNVPPKRLVELPGIVRVIYDDSDTEYTSESSAAMLSRSVSPALSTSQTLGDFDQTFSDFVSDDLPVRTVGPGHRFLYPLHEPGERIAERTRRLRIRTAAVIRSLPATVEEIIDISDDHSSQRYLGVNSGQNVSTLSVNSSSKLRRVSGTVNLRGTFHESGRVRAHPSSTSPTELSRASLGLGMLAPSARSMSPISAYSSVDTLVDHGHELPHSSGDVKAPSDATVSSTTISSMSSAKSRSTLPPSLSSPAYLLNDHSKPMFQQTQPSRNPSTHLASHDRGVRQGARQNTQDRGHPGDPLWSCAKIAQSTTKRAARRGHAPRKSRVFSNPSLAALALSL